MAVTPLHKVAKVKRMIVSTYQAASGAGAAAMEELKEQTRDVLEGKEAKPVIFPYQVCVWVCVRGQCLARAAAATHLLQSRHQQTQQRQMRRQPQQQLGVCGTAAGDGSPCAATRGAAHSSSQAL